MVIVDILKYLEEQKYTIVQADTTSIITAVDMKTPLIIVHSVSGRTIIAYGNDGIRFLGLIENLKQLKVVLRLINKLPVK